jgi:hypothetical protein
MPTPAKKARMTAEPATRNRTPEGVKSVKTKPPTTRVAPRSLTGTPNSFLAQQPTRMPKPPRLARLFDAPRQGTKAARILELLTRPHGASVAELIQATGWQPHSIRGHLSGVRKKMGLTVTCAKNEDGRCQYFVKF